MTPQLHDYQLTAAEHLRAHPRAALFLDMGLGKTATTLSALSPDHLPALVVAPKRVAESVWPAETKLWRPDLRCVVAAGGPTTRSTALLDRRADVLVIGRDNLKDLNPLNTARFRTIILDELSGFKTRGTQRWRFASKLCAGRPYVWGLTGTPAPNGLMDLWAQLYLIDDGERLSRSLTTFRSRYFTPGRQLASGVITEWHLRPGADEKIHGLISDICLSMGTEGRIDLPPVTFNVLPVPLPPRVRALYKRFKRDLVADLRLLDDDLAGSLHTASSAAVLTNRLSQVTAGFLYPDDPTDPEARTDHLHREKIALVEEVREGTGSPVLVFYRYAEEREMLSAALEGAVDVRTPGALEAWSAGRIPVLLAHPASAGHGLNLQHGGHTIIWTTLPWSLEEWQQANKRLARQGQQHPVVIHLLIAEKTVDEVIRARLLDKADVQNALLAHLESPL